MDFLKLLVDSYRDSSEEHLATGLSKMEFLAEHVFGFTTYDAVMSEILSQKALEVFRAITERKTFEYVGDKEQYRWYVIMCNMPFFSSRIEWGSSIRGAWWNHSQPPLESCGLIWNGEQISSLTFASGEWESFANAVIEFSNG